MSDRQGRGLRTRARGRHDKRRNAETSPGSYAAYERYEVFQRTAGAYAERTETRTGKETGRTRETHTAGISAGIQKRRVK